MKVLKSITLERLDNTIIFKAKHAGAVVLIATHYADTTKWKGTEALTLKTCMKILCYFNKKVTAVLGSSPNSLNTRVNPLFFIPRPNFHLNNRLRKRDQPSCFVPTDGAGEINRFTIHVSSFEVWSLRLNRWKDRLTGRQTEGAITLVRGGMAHL